MTADVLIPTDRVDVTRIAATGAPVALSVPTAFGDYSWYGNTRFTGPRLARQFFLAPAGEHRVIASHIMPGATQSRRSMRGYDVVLLEAPDRSDSALVFAGPYNEATTWFGGPAPDAAGLGRMVNTFTFLDSPSGATLKPASNMLVAQPDVTLIGQNEGSVLMMRRAYDALPTLPDWSGLKLSSGELWRGGRVLDSTRAGMVAGTPHQWRYLLAGPSTVTDLVLLGPESGRLPTALSDQQIIEALDGFAATWNG